MNRLQSGYNLHKVINRIDELRFRTRAENHKMSHVRRQNKGHGNGIRYGVHIEPHGLSCERS
jgi:type I restriction enzyme M protein